MKTLIDKRNCVLGMLHDCYITRSCLVYVTHTLGFVKFCHVYVLTPPFWWFHNGFLKINCFIKAWVHSKKSSALACHINCESIIDLLRIFAVHGCGTNVDITKRSYLWSAGGDSSRASFDQRRAAIPVLRSSPSPPLTAATQAFLKREN